MDCPFSMGKPVPGITGPTQAVAGHRETSSEGRAVTSEATSQVEYFDYEGASDEMFEYEQNDKISVKSSLKEHLQFWKNELPMNEFIYDELRFGYGTPFELFPPKKF